MKSLVINIIVLWVLIISAVCMAAAENPNVGATYNGAGTTVPSQGQPRRLLTSPNPLAASSNDVVTGNVGGLRYFHGVVPYGSRYYTDSSLSNSGSGSISSFLRRSTDPILSDRNPTQTRVYYEPQRTVSSFYVQGGRKTPISEATTRVQSRRNPTALSNLTDKTTQTDSTKRPLSTNNQELDQILARQFELREKAKETARESILDNQGEFENFFKVVLEPEDVVKPTLEDPITQQQVEQRLEETPARRQLEEIPEPQIAEDKDTAQPESELVLPLPERLPLQPKILEQSVESTETEPAQEMQSTDTKEGISMEKFLERADLHAEAERIRGEHSTTESLAKERFSDYMQAAEEFMRDGKFYKAADTYSLAAIWKPGDPRPHAGQAFALFAAGEYMSSAFYLSQAIEIDPAFAEKKFDLAELIGDRDVFENRLIEITTWQQRSNSGELAFLMAYVLHQDGKTTRAVGSIQRAEEKMPDNKAVSILKDVIMPSNGTGPE